MKMCFLSMLAARNLPRHFLLVVLILACLSAAQTQTQAQTLTVGQPATTFSTAAGEYDRTTYRITATWPSSQAGYYSVSDYLDLHIAYYDQNSNKIGSRQIRIQTNPSPTDPRMRPELGVDAPHTATFDGYTAVWNDPARPATAVWASRWYVAHGKLYNDIDEVIVREYDVVGNSKQTDFAHDEKP